MEPLRQAERRQSGTAAALASEKESLRKEVANWKKRVTSLTASFNAVGAEGDGLFLPLVVFLFFQIIRSIYIQIKNIDMVYILYLVY